MKALGSLFLIETFYGRRRPVYANMYQVFLDFASECEECSNDELEKIRKHLYGSFAKKLLSFSGYLSEYAILKNSEKYLHAALVFHCIEDTMLDYRENIRYLVIILFSANILKIDFNNLVNRILPLCTEKTKKHFESFKNRDPSLNQLQLFDLQFSNIKGRPRFKKI
ncbi:hypothetical protein [Leptospira vanthielii]|uniref:DUF1564 family protein n=1 Tax=Leptospira vanthielii TaxID=293085 RepID=A0ABY2NK08_9LEPT|nr:hypothetical protein [Leptospira vanthielii]TGM46000.1 hypothetical protein EHQ95_17605 [Leptospira vanthielii]